MKTTPQISRSKQVVYLIFGGGLSQLSIFLTYIILARKFSSVDYGTYRQVFLVCNLIVPIFSSAIPNSLLYFLPRLKTNEEKSAFVRRTLLLLVSLGALTSMVMIIFAGIITAQFKNPDLRQYLFYASLYPCLTLCSSYLTPFMIAIGQARLSAWFSSISSLINLIFVVVVAFTFCSIKLIIFATTLSSLISFIVALYFTNKHLKIFTKTGSQSITLKEQLTYAIPLGLASVVSIWGLKLDQAIVSSYFDVSAYAIYSVGAMEFPIVGLISSSIYSVLLPEISRLMSEDRKEEVLKLWKSTVEKSMLIIMPIFGAAMIMSYPLITKVYTQKYEASVPIFQIYLFLIPIRTISFGLLLRAIGKTKYDFFGSILFFAVNITFAISTIRFLGIYGPTISMVVSVYILATYLLFNIKKETGFNFTEILNLNALIPILLITMLPLGLFGIITVSFGFKSIINAAIILCLYTIFVMIYYKGSGKWSKLKLGKA